MIHRIHNTDKAEINRVLELIQKNPAASVVSNTSASPSGGGGGISVSVAATGAKGDKGDKGDTGDVASMLVGTEMGFEVLVADNGDVLTDEFGYALMGVKVYTTIITGAGSASFEVLNAT